jgi:hypothetical protein
VQKDESFLSVSGAGTLSFKSFSTNSGVPCLNQKCSEIPNTSSGPLCQGFGFLQNGEANKVHFVASGSRQKQLRFFFLILASQAVSLVHLWRMKRVKK